MLWALIAHVISRISMKDVDVLKSQRHENIWYSMVSVKFSHQMPLTVVKCREMAWNVLVSRETPRNAVKQSILAVVYRIDISWTPCS